MRVESVVQNNVPLGIEVQKHVHAKNRSKLLEELNNRAPKSIVLLKGGDMIPHYNTDTNYEFRQESFFMWLFGVREPDFYGALDVRTGRSYLFVQQYPAEYCIWMGPLPTLKDITKKYGVDQSYYIDQMDDILYDLQPDMLLMLTGFNHDSGITMAPPNFRNEHRIPINYSILWNVICECRVIKSNEEIATIAQACAISCTAHKFVMQAIGSCTYEYQAESLFKNSCYFVGGCRTTAYTNNCSSGTNSAVLHYGDTTGPNDKMINSGDMCLFDMGASFAGYASDITISFPKSGRFTPRQKIIYEAVLAARDAVLNSMKPGVSWVEMHLLANKHMLMKLIDAGLLVGDVNDMIEAELPGILQPHGLGHMLGVDVHDVGGYSELTPEKPKASHLRSLRTARVLREGMVLTVEPGCYFIEPLLNKARYDTNLSRFIVWQELDKYRDFGGVRIEDVVAVTKNGNKVLSPLPRKVEEIEALMEQQCPTNLPHFDAYQTPVVCLLSD